jgi:hypothetical protein
MIKSKQIVQLAIFLTGIPLTICCSSEISTTDLIVGSEWEHSVDKEGLLPLIDENPQVKELAGRVIDRSYEVRLRDLVDSEGKSKGGWPYC